MVHLLGIDTGGTYTDAVIVDEALNVLASAKSLTTKHDLALGVEGAVGAVLEQVPGDIALVSLSTTLATNALVEGQGSPICLLLLGYPPESLERSGLREVMGPDPAVFIGGGHDAAGAELAPLDTVALEAAVRAHAGHVAAFAVSGYFAVRNPAHEQRARSLVRELTGMPVTCGHQLASALDAPRRALTAALNARLVPLLEQLIQGVQSLLGRRGIRAPLMVVKGDGSLISAAVALECPVETILSGPAASVVGARQLSGEDDVLVVDMGGTTTDIAVLERGRPVLNRDGASVGGWRTMVEAVQVHTFGLGGDSELHLNGGGAMSLGPRRVVPLSLLSHHHPPLLETLEAQSRETPLPSHAGQFALRLRPPDPTRSRLSRAQAKVWDALERGPRALEALLTDHTLELPLSRLVERGLVALASFTPSDAAHVLGLQQDWSVQGATAGARIWRRLLPEPPANEAAFCERVLDQVALQSARYLVTSALAEEKGEVLGDLPPLQRELVDPALDGGGGTRLLGVRLSLKRPLVAIGAPVATYYPRVVERLETRLCIPEHAGIANALGAVAGGVMQRASAHITPVGDTEFRVHAPSGVRTFRDLEQAADYASEETARRARDLAHQAGAVELQLHVTRRDNMVRGGEGLALFIEAHVTATAFGRPRLALGSGLPGEPSRPQDEIRAGLDRGR